MTSSIGIMNAQSLDFSFQTSSGDKISLNLYNKESLEYTKSSNANSTTRELILKRERGLSFHYEGNGIDERDKKEIQEAMDKIKDVIDQFLSASPKEKKQKDINSKLTDILNPLKSDNVEKNEYTKSSLLETFSKLLKEYKEQEKELQKIFKNPLEEFEPFTFYA